METKNLNRILRIALVTGTLMALSQFANAKTIFEDKQDSAGRVIERIYDWYSDGKADKKVNYEYGSKGEIIKVTNDYGVDGKIDEEWTAEKGWVRAK